MADHERRFGRQLARWAVRYLERVPAHRGQARMINELGRALGPVPVECERGVQLQLRLDSLMDRSYAVRGTLDHAPLLAELGQLRPGDIFVDVGANAGLYSVLAARAVAPSGRVLAFEPAPDEFARLSWAVAANGVHNVLCSNTALGDTAGFASFVPGPRGHTGLHRLGGPGEGGAPQRVWVERGEQAIQLAPGERIALAKLDVEGAELMVLRGLGRLLESRRIARLVVEVCDEFARRMGSSAAELYAFLAALGYVPTRGPLPDWQYDEVFVSGG